MLDGFGDEGVDEEGDFLFCWWHFGFLLSLVLGLVGFLVVEESWVINRLSVRWSSATNVSEHSRAAN